MKKIHLIMPMGGAGTRFFKNGFNIPKPLINIHDKPFFYWATQSIAQHIDVLDITFVILKEHIEKYEIDKEIKKYYPNAKIIIIPEVLNGAVLTCIEGVKEINDDNPIIFNDCDHAFISNDFNNFCKSANFELYDGALLTFNSDDPKYSYLKLDNNDNVIETVEKKVVSNNAICGAYYFKNKKLFLDSSSEYLKECNYSEYFVSGVYNIMAKNKKKIHNFKCEIHVPFGTPNEYYEALNNEIFKG